jgi:hypothetical protein
MKPFGSKILLCSLLWGVLCVFPLRAQEPTNPPSSPPSPNVLSSASSLDPFVPLAVKDKFTLYLKKTYGPTAFLKSGAIAGINQGRNHPMEWGRGWDGYGDRFGSSMGQRAVANTITFGVRALRGEDPRYFLSGQTRISARIKSAVAQTLVVHSDNGGRTVALGRIAGAFGGGVVSRTWHPEGDGILWPGIQSGAMSLVYGALSNIFHEFWPDIKKHLPHQGRTIEKGLSQGSEPAMMGGKSVSGKVNSYVEEKPVE